MSNSDDSDNENLKQLIESTDSSLLTDSLYKKVPNPINFSKANVRFDLVTSKSTPNSQRYLKNEDTLNTDIKISKSMQDYIARKLSDTIASKIEFIHKDGENYSADKTYKKRKQRSRVRLLKDFDVYIKDEVGFVDRPLKKPKIKRRIIEPDNLSDQQKLEESVIDPSTILAQSEVKHWAKRREKQGKIFRYKTSKDGKTLHFLEPENEFSTLRKKNCWHEKKISSWKNK